MNIDKITEETMKTLDRTKLKLEIEDNINDLSRETSNELMNLRENVVNSMNGIMDQHAEQMIRLQQRIRELERLVGE